MLERLKHRVPAFRPPDKSRGIGNARHSVRSRLALLIIGGLTGLASFADGKGCEDSLSKEALPPANEPMEDEKDDQGGSSPDWPDDAVLV